MTGSASPHPAYRVPWLVDRSRRGTIVLRNGGDETLTHVCTQFFGNGWMEPAVPRSELAPGESLRVMLFGLAVADDGRVAVHWRRSTGEEYAWTFVCG